MARADRPYGLAAISLHWAIAALIVFQIGYAWFYLAALPDESAAHANGMVLHKSIGLTVLALSLARLALRLAVRPAPLPAALPGWDRTLARISHALFYVLIIGLPLTGWAMASMRPAPIPFWGLFSWPHLPGMSGFTAAMRHQIGKPLGFAHTEVLVVSTVVLLALHIAGALKNQFSGAPVFWRMAPFMRPKGA
jgi:cytochrome b561